MQKEISFKGSAEEAEEGNKVSGVKDEDYRTALKKLEESHPAVKTSISDAGSIMEVFQFKGKSSNVSLTVSQDLPTFPDSSPLQG